MFFGFSPEPCSNPSFYYRQLTHPKSLSFTSLSTCFHIRNQESIQAFYKSPYCPDTRHNLTIFHSIK
jgi:hypothetical protein